VSPLSVSPPAPAPPSSPAPAVPPAGSAATAASAAGEAAPSALRRLAAAPWVVSTYFAEGLPFSVVRQLSSELFTSMGTRPETIGATSLYNLAWNLKLLWSPLLDRYGSLRRWLLGAQAALGLVVIGVAWRAGEGDLGGVAKLLVVAAFLAATHDIAIDGFYLEALDKHAQTALAGLRTSAFRLALLAGKGLLALAGALQIAGFARTAAWRATFAAAGAALIVLAGVHALVLPRPPPRRAAGQPQPGYLDAFVSFLAQPQAAVSLAFIILYKAGDSPLFAMNAPFLKSLGLGDLARGAVGTAGMIASISGAIAGGGTIARFGLRRTLRPIVAVQGCAILLYVALAVVRPSPAWVSVVAVLEQLAAGIGDSALAVFLMRRCAKEHKAAHYAIASALMSVMSTAAGVSSGYLVSALGFPAFFALAFAASLPGMALAWWVPQD
jgi:PAT family beta-lactamase induction signal transducer AmpG